MVSLNAWRSCWDHILRIMLIFSCSVLMASGANAQTISKEDYETHKGMSNHPVKQMAISDEDQAAKLVACRGGDGNACADYAGTALLLGKTDAESDRALVRACELTGKSNMCSKAAYALVSSEHIPSDYGRAYELITKYCPQSENSMACMNADRVMIALLDDENSTLTPPQKVIVAKWLCDKGFRAHCAR